MQYDLDPRLLPPAGASVQCTRCGFVFTAMPSGEVLVPSQAQGAQTGSTPKPGEPARSAVGTTTRVFGSPYAASAKPGGSVSQTQVFGASQIPGPTAPPGVIAPDRTPAYGSGTLPGASPQSSQTPVAGSPAVGASSPSVGRTQVFGAAPQPLPAPANTQVFGAPSIPAKAPSVATTQVFGAASIPQQPAPSPATTQVFGAASIPQQPAPSPATTQVFGSAAVAAKASAATTTQVFGAASIPAPKPTTATTQTFGAAEVEVARRAVMEGAAPPPPADNAPAPWLAEPGPAPALPRILTGERPAVPPAPSIELPEEPAAPVGAALPSFPPEPAVARSGAFAGSQRSAPIDLPPELIAPSRVESPKPAERPTPGGGRERVLIILAAVVALGLTAWLSYPVWRNQGSELPPDALSAKDRAVSLLRRDDATAREQAIALLRTLVERHPRFTEAQAELVVALSLQLDDVKTELEWISLEGQRLEKEIAGLELAKSPADWQGRVSARREELGTLSVQKQPLDAAVAGLTKQLQAPLAFIRDAPETEPSADVVARYKAQAVHEGVQGNAQAIGLADRLDKVESPRLWSVVTRVEYGLNAPSPPNALPPLVEELAQVRQQDKTFFRAYVLGARLALRQKDPDEARALLDTVVALNPNHTLARKLQQRAAAAAASAP